MTNYDKIFGNLPLNTKRRFVAAKAISGCEVYIPVDSNDESFLEKKRDELRQFFANQITPLEPIYA